MWIVLLIQCEFIVDFYGLFMANKQIGTKFILSLCVNFIFARSSKFLYHFVRNFIKNCCAKF